MVLPKTVSVSVPGKLVLLGEHAVLHGHPALSTAINRSVKIVTTLIPEQTLQIDSFTCPLATIRDFASIGTNADVDDFPIMFTRVLSWIKTQNTLNADRENSLALIIRMASMLWTEDPGCGLNLQVCSDIPVGVGLGSSGAYCVGVVAALLSSPFCASHPDFVCLEEWRTKRKLCIERIVKWAILGETLFHGNSSGVDPTTSAYGGTIYYTRSFHNTFENDMLRRLGFVIGNTRIDRSTKDVISSIDPNQDLMEEIGQLVKKATTLSLSNTHEFYLGFKDLVRKNHDCLRRLGASHWMIDEVLEQLNGYGIGGKITGAGKGGCFFLVFKTAEEQAQIVSVLNQYPQIEWFGAGVGIKGLDICWEL